MSNEITIEKRAFEETAASTVSNGIKKFREAGEQYRDGRKEEDVHAEMANLAASMFHMNETMQAVSAMGEEIFRESETVTLTKEHYDKIALQMLDRVVKEKTERQEDGKHLPIQIMLGGIIAWNLALKELRKALFGTEESREDVIFQSARESIRRETEKPETDLEKNLRKFGTDGGPVGQTAWSHTEANQENAASAPKPEQGGTENLERAQMDKATEKIKECDFRLDAKEVSECSKDPGFRRTVENLEKRRTFLGHIRQRFGF